MTHICGPVLGVQKLCNANTEYAVINSRHITTKRLIQRKKAGLHILLGTGLLGVGVWYIENHTLRQRLRIVRDIKDHIKPEQSYIYVRESDKSKAHKSSNKVLFPWIKSRSHDPHTLLRLALSEDHAVRLLGIKALAQPHKWSDADYLMLAQALDPRALIGLARMPNADPRFFLPQPNLPTTEECIEDQLRHLLSSLPLDNLDRCTKYFTSSALQEGNQSKKEERFSVWTFDGASMLCEETVWKQPSSSWVEDYFIQAVLGASTLPSHCAKIVQLGGLTVFQRIYEARQNSIKILRSMARILSNLAVHESLHHAITKSGWVAVLHTWLNSKDLALSLYAAKALANLDLDFGGNKKYVDGVFLYYPQKRYSEPVYADIVFVHGLMGGPFRTWRQDDSVLQQLREERKRKLQEINRTSDTSKKSVLEMPVDFQTKENSEKSTDMIKEDKNVSKAGNVNAANTSETGQKYAQKAATNDQNITCDKICDISNQRQMIETDDVKHMFDTKESETPKWDLRKLFSLKQEPEDKKKRNLYTFCWPKDWLAKDIPNIRIITVEYDTHLSEWAPKCPYESEKRALLTRSKELLDKLRDAGIGDRPVIWVGHSMGGLLIKQMLVTGATDVRYSHIVDQTQGIVFYSVPHKGSPLAVYGNSTKYLFYPSVEVKELKMGSPHLLNLHKQFKNLMFHVGVPILSLAEGEKTDLPFNLKVMIVPEESSNPEFGDFYLMKKLNHLNICKPVSDMSPLYQLTLHFLQDCLPLHRVPHILKATVPDEFSLSEDEVS